MKIAFFDSGVGGLTIFKKAFENINAEYIYFADNLNTPYGIKSKETVRDIVIENVKRIIEFGADIVVIACNTATSVAINELRDIFKDKCIIGTEPAIKVAVDENLNNKNILVCATSLTTKEEKIRKLIDKLNVKERTSFLPLDELVKFAEKLDFNSPEVKEYLKEKFSNINFDNYSHIVLGCTHFPLFRGAISSLVPNNIEIVDSAQGVVKNLKNSIIKLNLDENKKSNVTLMLTKKEKNFSEKFIAITDIKEFSIKIV